MARVAASSSDQAVLPDAGLMFSGGIEQLRLTITPAPNTLGTATVTVLATDEDGMTGQASFAVTVVQQQVSFRQFVRDSFADAETAMPRNINSRQFDDDAAGDDFADLLAQP